MIKKLTSLDIETILISDEKEFAFSVINFRIGGFLLKPIEKTALVNAVQRAYQQIQLKKVFLEKRTLMDKIVSKHPGLELIGIPTIEGYEFIKIEDIVRCEGLQKCTRVVTISRSDIISSYNIGVFRGKLEPFGFFSPHKSHLINLGKVQKYFKEGTITLSDNSTVPVARRKKTKFLALLPHF